MPKSTAEPSAFPLPASAMTPLTSTKNANKSAQRQLLAYVPLAAHIRRVLDDRHSHQAPASRFRDELEDFMSEPRAEETMDAIVSWGRYAEVFAYHDDVTGSASTTRPDRQ